MRRLMVMTTVVTLCVVLGYAAAPQMELAATAELASFGEISKKVNALGTMINNPLVPALVLGSGQQQLVQKYGSMRTGSPIHGLVYVQTKALEDAARKNALDKIDEMFDFALLYPSVDGLAKMTLNHPGSVKGDDGTLHLLASASSPEERWVKFTEDGRYCAFASSAALALRAAADFSAKRTSSQVKASDPALLHLELTECGLKTLLTYQELAQAEAKRQKKNAESTATNSLMDRLLALQVRSSARQQELLGGYSRLTTTIDLNESGLTVACRLLPKAGVKLLPAAGFRLPAGALDVVPKGAPFFAALNPSLQGGYSSEEEFRVDCTEVAKLVREDVIPELKKNKDAQKYAGLLDEIGCVVGDYLQAVPYPSKQDWNAFALAFDAQRYPYVVSVGESAALPLYQQATRSAADRISAAFDRQWPTHKVLSRAADDTMTLDWGAIIDIAAAEGSVGAKHEKEIAQAKKTVAAVLGSTKTVCSSKVSGTKFSARVAYEGFKEPTVQPFGEKALAQALPETVKDRPAGALYLTPYALTRDIILPVVAKLSDKETAAQYQTMLASMSPAAPNSALAAAGWVDADGTMRGILRLTSGEIRNLGAAFNAFTAAALSSSAEEEDK